MRTTSAQPSASGPSSSQRHSGTPSSRRTDSALGTVQTRSGRSSRSTTGGEPPGTDGTGAAADGPFDDVTAPPPRPAPRCTPCPRLVARADAPGGGAPEGGRRSAGTVQVGPGVRSGAPAAVALPGHTATATD